MKIILVRHGEADNASPDSARSLTEKGRGDVTRISRLIASSGWKFERVFSSPLRRAVQTASIISETLHLNEPTVLEALNPPARVDELIQNVYDLKISGAVVCVFHMPDIAEVAADLLGISSSKFYISPGTALALNISQPSRGSGMLIWKMQPEMLADFQG